MQTPMTIKLKPPKTPEASESSSKTLLKLHFSISISCTDTYHSELREHAILLAPSMLALRWGSSRQPSLHHIIVKPHTEINCGVAYHGTLFRQPSLHSSCTKMRPMVTMSHVCVCTFTGFEQAAFEAAQALSFAISSDEMDGRQPRASDLASLHKLHVSHS